MYYYIKFPSGNTYIMKGGNNDYTLKVEAIISIKNEIVAKKVGEIYYMPVSNKGVPFSTVMWIEGTRDYIYGLATLDFF